MKKICVFCNIDISDNYRTTNHIACNICQTHHYYFNDDLFIYQFIMSFNNRDYWIVNELINGLYITRIVKIPENTSIKFDKNINITPANAYKKLPMILTFL